MWYVYPAYLECWITDEAFRTCGMFVTLLDVAPDQAKPKQSHKIAACVLLFNSQAEQLPMAGSAHLAIFEMGFMNMCVDSKRQLDAVTHQKVNISRFMTCTHLRKHQGSADGGWHSWCVKHVKIIKAAILTGGCLVGIGGSATTEWLDYHYYYCTF